MQSSYPQPKPADVPHRSVAIWPASVSLGSSDNSSRDAHRSKEAAQAVCDMLREHGLGGDGKIFPLSTYVEPIEKK